MHLRNAVQACARVAEQGHAEGVNRPTLHNSVADNVNRGADQMKIAALALCVVALALGACRRESPEYVPMKLGGQTTDTAR